MSGDRNPDWTRDETILLMDLYSVFPRAGRTHPEVMSLSVFLRERARQAGQPVGASFRNPAGIAMRLRNFGRHDPDAPPGRDAGLRAGGEIDVAIWREFGGRPADLSAAAARVRRSLAASQPFANTSRGPAPSFGIRTAAHEDGPTDVYLLVVEGPMASLVPNAGPPGGMSVVKVGRTANLGRRIAELSSGLPPACAIRHVPIAVRHFRTADEAHSFERRMLDLFDERGWALGGEFALAPLAEVRRAMSSQTRRK